MTSPVVMGAVVAGAAFAAYELVPRAGHPNMVNADDLPPAPAPTRAGRKSQMSAQVGQLVYNGALAPPPHLYASGAHQPSGMVSGPQAAATDNAKKAAIEAAARKGYEDLSDVERARGADALNHTLKPSPNLNAKMTWKEAGAAIGASLGAAAGTAIVAAIPGVGPLLAATGIGATLGALIGGYLGATFAAWAEKQWNKAVDWVEDKASDAYDAVEGAAEDAYHYIGDLF